MIEDELGRVARRQWGTFTHAQALAVGISRWAIQRRLATGDWVEIERKVYRFRGGHDSWHQRVMAGALSLGPDARASHGTAAFLWGLDRMRSAPPKSVELTVPYGNARPLIHACIHHTRRPADRAVWRQQIPATPLARTLLDLADAVADETLFIALASARRMRPSVVAETDLELRRCGPGRHGAFRLAALLELARSGREIDSALEARAIFAIHRRDLPPPTRQEEVRDLAGRRVGRVDLIWTTEQVIVECDSRAFHFDPEAFEADLLRRRKLESHGWRLVHLTWKMLSDDDWLADLALLLDPQRLLALS